MGNPYEPKNPNTQLYLIGRKIQEWSPLITVIVSAIALFIIGAQALIYWKQARLMETTLTEIRSGGEVAQKAANAASEQAKVMQRQLDIMQDQANSMKAQTNTLNDSLAETRKSVNAAERQANASMSQANTSQVSARAAEESARISRYVYEAGQRPKVSFKWVRWKEKPEVNKQFWAEFAITNNGGSAYGLTTEITTAIVPQGFTGTLPYGREDGLLPFPYSASVINGDEKPLELGADVSISTRFRMTLNESGIRLLDEESVFIMFYGHIWWTDALGRKDGFSFCRRYDKKLFPELIYCDRAIKIPKGGYPY